MKESESANTDPAKGPATGATDESAGKHVAIKKFRRVRRRP